MTNAAEDQSAEGSTRTGPLNREQVLDAAVELADEIGATALTIRKLAGRLGVKPMSLYHHVPNKDAILDGMVDRVFAEIEDPPLDQPWREAIANRCRSGREVLRRHPWAIPLLESRTSPGPATLGHHDTMLGCFRAAGFSLALTAHAYAVLDAFLYGFAIQEASLPGGGGEELTEVADEMVAAFPDDAYHHLREFTFEHVAKPGYHFGHSFEYGLDILLDGLAAALAREADDSPSGDG